jgi:L-threonylcarbamoyladenylate synthase
MILDAGQTPRGLESTVIDLTTDPPGLLRPGPILPTAIERIIGPLRRVRASSSTGPLPSPGMMDRHYAPKAVVECLEYGFLERVKSLKSQGVKVALLTMAHPDSEAVSDITIVMPLDPETYAAHLYAHLHALDSAEVDRIVVALPPDEERWLAVRDRLLRASAQE